MPFGCSTAPALRLAGEANGQTHPIFRQVSARVLAKGVIGGIAGMGRWQCRCTRIRCSGATSRWRPSGLAAGVCGLSADLVHRGKALCMAGRLCIENIELTCTMLRGVDHARPWWLPAPWDTYEVQRSANLWLCGGAPQCKCSGGIATRATVHSSDTPPPPSTGRQAARMGCEAGTGGAPRGKGRGEGEGQG